MALVHLPCDSNTASEASPFALSMYWPVSAQKPARVHATELAKVFELAVALAGSAAILIARAQPSAVLVAAHSDAEAGARAGHRLDVGHGDCRGMLWQLDLGCRAPPAC